MFHPNEILNFNVDFGDAVKYLDEKRRHTPYKHFYGTSRREDIAYLGLTLVCSLVKPDPYFISIQSGSEIVVRQLPSFDLWNSFCLTISFN